MNGVLIVNKPKGFTSHDVVNVLRKKLNIKKIGHTGTLDPNATGVLPILIGQATKISKYLIEHNKTYIAELKLGEKSNTGDIEGEIIETKKNPNISVEQIETVLESFMGKQQQIPPIFSAIKINGKKAYEYARKNKKINLPPREIEIFDIELINFINSVITYKVSCSKGTYIRVLCEDIATKLGTVGLMQNLERVQVDAFKIEDSITLEEVKDKRIEKIQQKIVPIEEIFSNRKSIDLNSRKTELFLNGVKITQELPDGVYRIYYNNKFIGLGIIENNLLKRDIVIRRLDGKRGVSRRDIQKTMQFVPRRRSIYSVLFWDCPKKGQYLHKTY